MKRKHVVSLLLAITITTCALSVDENLVLVEGDSYQRGAEESRDNPLQIITLNSFYISKYEVTVREWEKFIEETVMDFEWTNDYWGSIEEISPNK